MKKSKFDFAKLREIGKEAIYLLIAFAVLAACLKIAFFRESMANVMVLSFSIFWLGVLPGYSAMLYYLGRLGFLARLVIGTVLGYSLMGITSYYLGLMGVHLKMHHYILPPVIIAAGLLSFVLFWQPSEGGNDSTEAANKQPGKKHG